MRLTGHGVLALCVLSLAVATSSVSAQNVAGSAGNWGAVEAALGRPGAMQPGNVVKFSFPRSDLTVIAEALEQGESEPSFVVGLRDRRTRPARAAGGLRRRRA